MRKKTQTLHILKSRGNRWPLELIEKQAKSQAVAILLTHDAVGMDLTDLAVPVFVLSEGLGPKQKSPHRKIAAAKMLALIFEADAVMVW